MCGGVSDLLLFTLTFYRVPLIWPNMGEHGVWGCFGSFTFHSQFLLRSANSVKYGGTCSVGECFGSFTFHSHFLPRSIGTAESWQNNKDYQMLWEFSQVSI